MLSFHREYTILKTLLEKKEYTIYRAIRRLDNTPVLLKVVKEVQSPLKHAQLKHEFALMQRLQLPHILKAYALEFHPEAAVLVLEDSGGHLLVDDIHHGKTELLPFLKIAVALAQAIGDLHNQLIILKGLHPQHILFNPENNTLKITDLSIATMLSRSLPQILNIEPLNEFPTYISPEQTGKMNRPVDYRTDIYSLGILLYILITGKMPLPASNALGAINAHITVTPKPPHEIDSQCPSTLSALIMKCLEKEADKRFHSAYTLMNHLKTCLDQYTSQEFIEPFEIQKNEISDLFLPSTKIHGREEEMRLLIESLERSSVGDMEIAVISGESGVGKSFLVHEIEKRVVKKNGFFISGHFDQWNCNIPYKGFIEAFQNLINQLLLEDRHVLAQWKEKLIKALGANAQIIIDIIPELKWIIGEQQPSILLNTKEAEDRFNILICSFINVFLSKDHPVVLFLDNADWIDIPSVKLLQVLANEPRRHFFLIMAQRNNNQELAIPLHSTIANIKNNGGAVVDIEMRPLGIKELHTFLSDTFLVSNNSLSLLSRILFQKTHGNPLFFTKFLKILFKKGLVTFDYYYKQWKWDLESIQRLEIVNDVFELKSSIIKDLSPRTQELLKIAAVIGHSFDLELLAAIFNSNVMQVAFDLWEAISEDLLTIRKKISFSREKDLDTFLPMVNFVYKFVSERIQQAAYHLIALHELKSLHLTIGKQILQIVPQEILKEHIMQIVHHLNHGIDIITLYHERQLCSELNLQAGLNAKNSVAYEVALEYFTIGIRFLDLSNCWQLQHQLTLALYENRAMCELLLGQHTQADKTFDLLLKHAVNLSDKARVYTFKIVCYTQMALFQKSIECGLEALELFGISLKYPIRKYNFFVEIIKLAKNWLLQPYHKMASLPLSQEQYAIELGKIYSALLITAYYLDAKFLQFLIIKLINMTLRKGVAEYSSFAFVGFGLILVSQPRQYYAKGISVSQIAIKMAELFPASLSSLQTSVIYYGFVNVYKQHIKYALAPLVTLEKRCFETGLLAYASASLALYSLYLFAKGERLDIVQEELEKNLLQTSRYKTELGKNPIKFLLSLCDTLRGGTKHITDIATEEWKELLEVENPDGVALGMQFYYYTWSSFVHFLDEKYDDVLLMSKKMLPFLKVFPGSYVWTIYYFYQALALASLCRSGKGNKYQKSILKKLHKRIKKWSITCPANYLHKYLIISAELALIEGKKELAVTYFEEAILQAREQEYIYEEAIAYELFAKFYFSESSQMMGSYYLLEAYNTFAKWGAFAKLNVMKRKYGDLLPFEYIHSDVKGADKSSLMPLLTQKLIVTATGSARNADIQPIIDATQVISQEIILEKLLENCMRLIVEDITSERGFIILSENEKLMISAQAGSGIDGLEDHLIDLSQKSSYHDLVKVRLFKDLSLEVKQEELCLSVVHYVARSKKVVFIDDLGKEGLFKKDSYILSKKNFTILCVPLLYQAQLVGIIYLENRLDLRPLSSERIHLLLLLASQMAISIKNALFYANLENRVKERTKELNQKHQELEETVKKAKMMQNQLIEQEKLASLGALTAGVAHEIKNPLNFAINFSKLSSKIVDKLQTTLTKDLQDAKTDGKEIEESLSTLQKNIDTVIKQSIRADKILKRMLAHASIKNNSFSSVDIHTMLEDCISLSSHGTQIRNERFDVEFEKAFANEPIMVFGSAEDLFSVFINLFNNAYYAMGQKRQELGIAYKPKIVITTKQEGNHCKILLKDNGIGIPESISKNVFTPFYTTKPTQEGTGLGLSLSHNIIVQQHNGAITFHSKEGEFTEFVIQLPASK